MARILYIILIVAIICYFIHFLVGCYIKYEARKKFSKSIIQAYTKEYNKKEGMARYLRQLSYVIPFYNILLVIIEITNIKKFSVDYIVEITRFKKKKGIKV